MISHLGRCGELRSADPGSAIKLSIANERILRILVQATHTLGAPNNCVTGDNFGVLGVEVECGGVCGGHCPIVCYVSWGSSLDVTSRLFFGSSEVCYDR